MLFYFVRTKKIFLFILKPQDNLQSFLAILENYLVTWYPSRVLRFLNFYIDFFIILKCTLFTHQK